MTYCGTRNKNKKNLPAKTKTVKESENEFSAFFWKKDTPVALVSYVPKPGKNLLLISTGHEDPDICPEPHQNNKPTLVDFYNSQRCGVDVNREREMLKDYSSQPVRNSWTIVVFTFILGLSVINAQTVLKYNLEPHRGMSRQQFTKNLGYQLCMAHIKKRLQSRSLQKHVLDAINSVIAYSGNEGDNITIGEVSVDNSQNISVKLAKCDLCIVDLRGVSDKERRRRKSNLNEIQQFCVTCKKPTCP